MKEIVVIIKRDWETAKSMYRAHLSLRKIREQNDEHQRRAARRYFQKNP